MGRGAYQRHADAVRHQVALSGSAKNFVGGQIPRSTLHKWVRPRLKSRRHTKKYRGLHAKHPHEYWHLDVTKVRLADGSVQCLQVVLDNRSRAVLSWHISPTVRAENTAALIKRAKFVASRSSDKCESVHLIVDAGPENTGAHAIPEDAAAKPRVLRRIARREIRQANTMIEVFFKSLKSNYLNHKIIQNVDELRRAVSFHIKQQNEVIPRMALKGLTPLEVLAGVNCHKRAS